MATKQKKAEESVEAMKVAIRESFEEEYGAYQEWKLADMEVSAIQKTYDLYASWDWRYGKSPECETVYRKRFEWGEVEVQLKLKNLYVQECKVYSDSLDVEFPEKLEKVLHNQRFDMQNVKSDDEKICEVIKWLAQE